MGILLTPDEIASLLGESPGRVAHWISTGKLKSHGKHRKVEQSDLVNFLEELKKNGWSAAEKLPSTFRGKVYKGTASEKIIKALKPLIKK